MDDVNGGIVSDDNLQPLEELDGATDEASRMVEVGIKNESFHHGQKNLFSMPTSSSMSFIIDTLYLNNRILMRELISNTV